MTGTKLTESSKYIHSFCRDLRNGDVSLSDDTKVVWETDSVFMSHKLDNFWPMLNHINAQMEQGKGI